jgi:hypothetical protein
MDALSFSPLSVSLSLTPLSYFMTVLYAAPFLVKIVRSCFSMYQFLKTMPICTHISTHVEYRVLNAGRWSSHITATLFCYVFHIFSAHCLPPPPLQKVFNKSISILSETEGDYVKLNLQQNKKAYFIELYQGRVDGVLKIWLS